MEKFKNGDLVRLKTKNVMAYVIGILSGNYFIEDVNGVFYWVSEDEMEFEYLKPFKKLK